MVFLPTPAIQTFPLLSTLMRGLQPARWICDSSRPGSQNLPVSVELKYFLRGVAALRPRWILRRAYFIRLHIVWIMQHPDRIVRTNSKSIDHPNTPTEGQNPRPSASTL